MGPQNVPAGPEPICAGLPRNFHSVVSDNQCVYQAFVRSGKPLLQLEEEMLNGQKLQVRRWSSFRSCRWGDAQHTEAAGEGVRIRIGGSIILRPDPTYLFRIRNTNLNPLSCYGDNSQYFFYQCWFFERKNLCNRRKKLFWMQSSFKLILKSHFVGKCNLSKIQFALG